MGRLPFSNQAIAAGTGQYRNSGGDVHANSIESFWSQVKRGINGTYVWVLKKHLQLYLREFEYRHNLRKQPTLMFELLLQIFPKVRVE
ncbi:transposase [Tardiphaga sp. 20_F10_N6_6]|uniref:transposase n=1 Tax=unclassified Tardiphaga TaxID=2631404 RepID=UPI003F255880